MAQFVNKLRDCMRTVNLTMLLVLNLFFIVTLNLTVVTVLVVSEADHGFFIQDGSVSIGGALVILYASCILMAVSLVVAIRLVNKAYQKHHTGDEPAGGRGLHRAPAARRPRV